MAKENALSNDILDHLVGNATWTSPAPIHIALSDTGTEVTTGNAARVEVPDTDWEAAADGSLANSAVITFQEGGGDANVDGFQVWDAATGGTLLRTGTLTESFTWGSNVTPEFAVGACTLSES